MPPTKLPNISPELRKQILEEDAQAFSSFLPSTRHLWLILHEVIFGTDTSWGKRFDVVLLLAIVISLVAIMLESIPDFRLQHGNSLFILEWVLTAVFTLEYLLRVWVSDSPRGYVFSFFGIIDFLAVIPTYISLFVAGTHFLLVIRAIRLLRVFRILKLARYVKGAQAIGAGLKASKEKIFVFLTAVVTLAVIMGTLMYMIEGGEHGFDSIPRSIYWAIVTLTTVGYGDIAPETTLGQFVAAFVMILGYSIIAVPTGIVSAEMSRMSKDSSSRACQRCGETEHYEKARFCHKCGERIVLDS
ncbi:MAG: ion transporter [Flavobacteriales bacterium]|nr:ion transporter [Flavobacteriales bacterium]